MTTLLVDTSILTKWFHSESESQVIEARALSEATRRGGIEARVVDLTLYEMGDLLLRSLHWSGPYVADQLDDLIVICGSVPGECAVLHAPSAAYELQAVPLPRTDA